MPEKGKRKKTATRDDEAVFADGVIGRFVDSVFDNPAMSGGLFVMALTASAIVSNALFMQTVRHPEPLFSTRPPLTVERHAPAVPLPPQRDDQTGSVTPPLPRPSPLAQAPMPAPKVEAVAVAQDTTVRDIQTILARRGLYLGAIDGMYGALSRSAIMTYEKAAGLPERGDATPQILEHMRSSAAVTPLPPPVAAAPPAPVVAAIPERPVAPAAPAVPAAPSAEEVRAEIDRLRYERIQTALNRIGYGPVVVNGAADEPTVSAIRRFELDNGLPITGAIGDSLIERLVAIGALPAA